MMDCSAMTTTIVVKLAFAGAESILLELEAQEKLAAAALCLLLLARLKTKQLGEFWDEDECECVLPR